ncbi:MAG: hypothetical protein WA947_22365 [Phormidesmis sp.]
MTIHSVEQILDGAIALLLYGSGGWLSCSLVTFVATRQVVKPDDAIAEAALSDAVGSVVSQETVLIAANETIFIEVMPEIVSEVLPNTGFAVEAPPMVCQPVNWKKWKVGELRQASMTRVCGVRISPIGSSRKLAKADLIAQYEQALKRMTYEQPGLALRREKTA